LNHNLCLKNEAFLSDTLIPCPPISPNGLENFWSLLKRGISGTYVSVEPFHLFRYLDEQPFRYNNRKGINDQARFGIAMRHVFGKRLTYQQLTGGESATAQ
jgi:hypothetical protein